jgi:hypothetical protein
MLLDVWRSKKAEALMNAGMAAVAAAIVVIVAVPGPVASADHAFSALTGSWTGGGIVKMTATERFRCRSVYEPV